MTEPVLIPVTAESAALHKRNIRLAVAGSLAVLVAFTLYLYKRSTDPLEARASFDAGTRLFKIGRYNQAILSYDRAVALKPDLVDAYLFRGRSQVGQFEWEKAIEDFTTVTRLRPFDPTGWIERGSCYLQLENFPAAIADASRAVAVNQNEAAAYNLRGMALRKNGDPKRAIEDFTRAVQLEPNADHYYQRGSAYQLLGEHTLAIADFTRVISLVPELGSAYYVRAESRRAVGDVQGAGQDRQMGRYLDSR